jgi:hypothetical protein
MILKEKNTSGIRSVKSVVLNADFAVAGGGLSGVCAAITAARQGLKTVLVQDRPVLGGNASSEVRLWILGATSHMGNNNRWSREGGVVDEILIENLYRNSAGNPLILDTILLEKVTNEKNITLLLNTAVYDLQKSSSGLIENIKAFCSQNSTEYIVSAPLFCDATGDGIVGFKAGAAFRMGAESKDEFGELFAPEEGYGGLLGHTLYFYSKRADRPIKYIPPAFALKDIKQIPRYKIINRDDSGCRFWWLEYGGRRDTVHDTEEIKWELWKVVYGVWDYIKNSGDFEDVDDLTLEWVGTIPGKRESRRFEGLYMLKQQDLVEQCHFGDAVAHGGWAMDLHPADGVYSQLPGCTQWHTKGIYQIPYRCYVSKDIENLFIAGRIMSATHVAFGSTRVMATCGIGGQAVGMAAALCKRHGVNPSGLLETGLMKELQHQLNKTGQSIPGTTLPEKENLATTGKIIASGSLALSKLEADDSWHNLSTSVAQMLPLKKEAAYSFGVKVSAKEKTTLSVQLRSSSKAFNYTPDVILETITFDLAEGEQEIEVNFQSTLPEDQYGFVTFMANDKISIAQSSERYTGVLSVYNGVNKAVSNNGKQTPPDGIGIDTFEFWIPYRRPGGKNLAMKISPALDCFGPQNIVNGLTRPGVAPNAWVADPKDAAPTITIEWEKPVSIHEIRLFFDVDFDHPLESVLMGHPEEVIPFCVRNLIIRNEAGHVLHMIRDNYQSICTIQFEKTESVNRLHFVIEHPEKNIPGSIFAILIN